ncbi:C4-dicarboxylate ABC transporter [Rhodomicrobium udaipurense JA643]|uniref:TRAP transporter substrate-binding protein n=1 Tax=Rhodomicrobium udaipurense TaxID=1202716 RepID=A0A8I1GAF1_9HYPH|nr:TRAP transporter substrate-binding protein [Rhodomicrobium udaipurense]KAI95443.1 C4-dicarboxylate ABC transporter [Rhodomicrobium udaipurense JA643]MBJ7543483.1 TRAP transporter substrate-binding protein [Rhodomicrobium udaipurense]
MTGTFTILRAAAFALVCVAAGAFAVSPARAQAPAEGPLELHFSHIGAEGSLYYVSAEEYARRVEAMSRGRIRIVLHPKSGLGGDAEVLKKMLKNEVDISVIGTPMSNVAGEFGVFEMPFLVRNRTHVRQFRDKAMKQYLQGAANAKGYQLLAMWELGFRQILNNKRPVEGPGTLKGLKLRVPKGEWRIKMFKAYGVEPLPVEFKDVYAGIQRGELDGIESTLDLIYGENIHKVQQYLTLSYHLYTPGFLIMPKERYQALPTSARAILTKVGLEMQDWVLDRGEKIEAEIVQKMGLKTNEADRLAFTLQSLTIYKEYARVPAQKALIKLIFESDVNPLAIDALRGRGSFAAGAGSKGDDARADDAGTDAKNSWAPR